MEFFITSDAFWEARVEKAIYEIDETEYEEYFAKKNYGKSLVAITVVLMCQDPDLGLKPRTRLMKKEQQLYMDIMLDLNLFLTIEKDEKKKIIVEKLINEIPLTIRRYQFDDFDLKKFEKDLNKKFSEAL